MVVVARDSGNGRGKVYCIDWWYLTQGTLVYISRFHSCSQQKAGPLDHSRGNHSIDRGKFLNAAATTAGNNRTVAYGIPRDQHQALTMTPVRGQSVEFVSQRPAPGCKGSPKKPIIISPNESSPDSSSLCPPTQPFFTRSAG